MKKSNRPCFAKVSVYENIKQEEKSVEEIQKALLRLFENKEVK
jgi:hypothetical protein